MNWEVIWDGMSELGSGMSELGCGMSDWEVE